MMAVLGLMSYIVPCWSCRAGLCGYYSSKQNKNPASHRNDNIMIHCIVFGTVVTYCAYPGYLKVI